jgi:hypothetical protein
MSRMRLTFGSLSLTAPIFLRCYQQLVRSFMASTIRPPNKKLPTVDELVGGEVYMA